NYRNLHQWFAQAKTLTGFPGDLTVAFASKANPAEPVVRTLMQEGAPYECSSTFDVDVVREAEAAGWLDKNRLIISNGFKIPVYTQNLLRLRAEGFTNVLPIFEDISEIEPFAESGLTFEVGIRSRTHSSGINRFGMGIDDLEYAVQKIQAAGNLHLTTF